MKYELVTDEHIVAAARAIDQAVAEARENSGWKEYWRLRLLDDEDRRIRKAGATYVWEAAEAKRELRALQARYDKALESACRKDEAKDRIEKKWMAAEIQLAGKYKELSALQVRYDKLREAARIAPSHSPKLRPGWVVVREEDVAALRTALEESDKEQGRPRPPSTCPKCGECNEEDFHDCPSSPISAVEALLALWPEDVFDGSSGDELPQRVAAARAALPALRKDLEQRHDCDIRDQEYEALRTQVAALIQERDGIRMEVILEQAEERARLRRERDELRAERDEARDMEALTRGMLTGAEARLAEADRLELQRATARCLRRTDPESGEGEA